MKAKKEPPSFCQSQAQTIIRKIRQKIARGYLYLLENFYLSRPFTRERSLRLDRALIRLENLDTVR
jgi:hypothetical protein